MKTVRINWIIISIAVLMVLIPSIPAKATKFLATNALNFPEGELLEDDLVMTGQSVRIGGQIDGDLIAACRSVVINGDINGSILCADQYTKVFGNIDGSMRAFCQDAQLNGTVNRNVIVFCAAFTLGPEGRVERDVAAFAGEVTIEGRIGKNVIIHAGDAIIGGTIEGDVNIEADKITLLPTAVIKGNLSYKSDRPAKVEEGATVFGLTDWKKIEDTQGEKKSRRSWIGSITTISGIGLGISIAVQVFSLIIGIASGKSLLTVILFIVAAYLAMVLLIAIFKARHSRMVLETMTWKPLKTFSTGLVGFLLLPIAAIFFTVTLVGIPIALLLAFILGILCIAGWLLGALAMGDFILSRIKRNGPTSLYLSALIGIVLLVFLAGIPYLGSLIVLIMTFFGVGALLLTKHRIDHSGSDQFQGKGLSIDGN